MAEVDNGLSTSTDYKLTSCYIMTSDGTTADIASMIINLNLYEDIFTPYISGDLTLGDSLDIVSSLSLHGNEYILINLDKPSLGKPITKTFRIYKISDREFETQSLQKYKIHFCSEEAFISTQILMRKSYKGMSINSMITDILRNQLKVSDEKLKNGFFTSTAANFDIIIPRMHPLEAGLWLNTRAYNADKTLYFFFENRRGYNFISYEELIQQDSYKKYTRSPKVKNEPTDNYTSINYIRFVTDFDVLKGNRYGEFATSMYTFDMLNRKYTKTEYSATQLNSKNLLNKFLPANASTNRFNKNLFQQTDSMQKFVPVVDSDPNRNPIHPEAWLNKTALKLAQLQSLKIVINVPIDVVLTVGMIIELQLPTMAPQTANESFNYEIYKSGKYLISSVHHGISGQIGTTTLELLSDSYATGLPSPNESLGALKNVKQQ